MNIVIAVFVVLVVIAIVIALRRGGRVEKHAPFMRPRPTSTGRPEGSSHAPHDSGYVSPLDDGVRPGSDSQFRWDPHLGRRRRPVDPGSTYAPGSHEWPREATAWEPYAKGQSRTERVRAARGAPPAVSRTRSSYYQLLGIMPGATADEIEKAYRRAAAANHPDRFFDQPEKRRQAERHLKELNGAMQVLRDPIRRAQYDSRLVGRASDCEA